MKSLLSEPVQTYIDQVTDQPDAIQTELQDVTAKDRMAIMQTAHDQCVFMANMLGAMGAKKVLEIGVFTGYSALVMAQTLPEDGQLIACDVSEEWTDIAKEHWKKAGVDHKIDLRIAPAIETVQALIDDGQSGTFDFVYIDADKKSYEAYYEAALQLLRPNGLIGLDNMLWKGDAANPDCEEKLAQTIRALGLKLAEDKRVSKVMLSTGDGLYLLRKL